MNDSRLARRRLIAALAAGAAFAGLARTAAASEAEISWDDLVPKDWDPMKQLREKSAGIVSDADPRAAALMQELRDLWDNAPANPRMQGVKGKLAGYLVPLESTKNELKEFLLVPYFGACIHTPPPPANQIVHVRLAKPVKGMRGMEPVWVSGSLRTARSDSSMGVSAYSMDARSVERYVEAGR